MNGIVVLVLLLTGFVISMCEKIDKMRKQIDEISSKLRHHEVEIKDLQSESK